MIILRKNPNTKYLKDSSEYTATAHNTVASIIETIKILDSTLTLFKFSSKDASTSAAVEQSITPCLEEQ